MHMSKYCAAVVVSLRAECFGFLHIESWSTCQNKFSSMAPFQKICLLKYDNISVKYWFDLLETSRTIRVERYHGMYMTWEPLFLNFPVLTYAAAMALTTSDSVNTLLLK